MGVILRKSSRPVSAALAVPSKAYTYRFFLSFCFLVLILFSLTFRHADVGIFILCLMNYLFCADVFLRTALKDVWSGNISWAVLTASVTTAGLLYSALNVFLTVPLFGPVPDLYLYTSLFITLSLWAERRLVKEKERSRVFVKKLDDFLPKSGRLCVGRSFRKVFAGELKKGDLIFVKPGERLPADGTVKQGKTSVDEQLITGNMLPTSKNVGSRVFAGTLNKSAEMYVEVTEVLSASALMSVVSAIKKSELARSGFKSALDGFACWVLPLSVLFAAGAYAGLLYATGSKEWFLYSGVFLFMLAVSCPAALVFAAVSPSFFARRGAHTKKIKLQNIYALDEIVRADTVFFDKTGTLTYGELRVSGIYPAKKVSQRQLLETVATAEQLVDGPFADAVTACAKEHKISPKPLLCFDVLPGLGVSATSGEDKILAGRTQWLEEQNIKTAAKIAHADEAVICVAKNGKYLGYLTLADELRPGARELVAFLKSLGKEVMLISGDNESSVSAIAKEAGIAKINANVLPKTKAEIISNLRALGKRVLMVGDGFNDIIALLRADAGVVYSSGRNVYNNWVDVLIKSRDLYPVADLFKINKKLHRIITVNVLLAVLVTFAGCAGLVWFMPQAGWTWIVGGALAVAGLVFLNSTRMLNIK